MRGIANRRNTGTSIPIQSFIARCLSIVFILALTACSSSNPGAGSSGASTTTAIGGLPDPCTLITQAEAETALGKGATMSSTFNARIGMQQCHVKPATTGDIEEIIIDVHKADSWEAIKKAMLPPSSDAKAVSGLGEDAFVGRAIGYNVRKGSNYVQIFGVITNKDAANEKATRYLAERAASRL